MVADSDLAVGQLVDTISHSSIWSSSAIFVVEDDSQDGADHVDAHRIPVAVISPYARRGVVIHTRYDLLSVVRSIELIVGMKPLSLNDALATPMYDVFTSTAVNSAPVTVIPPQIDLLTPQQDHCARCRDARRHSRSTGPTRSRNGSWTSSSGNRSTARTARRHRRDRVPMSASRPPSKKGPLSLVQARRRSRRVPRVACVRGTDRRRVDLETLLDLTTPWCLMVASTLRIADQVAPGLLEGRSVEQQETIRGTECLLVSYARLDSSDR